MGDPGAHRADIGLENVGPGRRFHQQRLIALITDEVKEAGDRRFGGVVGRNARRLEAPARRRRQVLAEPGGKDIAVVERRGRQLGERVDHRLGGGVRIGQRGRAIQYQQPVDAVVADERPDRRGIARTGRVADDVDRIAVAPGTRQDLAKTGHGLRCQRGKPAAGSGERVGRQHTGAAAVADDRQPDAEMWVAWKLDWTAGNKNLWEEGVKRRGPASLTLSCWLRDAYFTDYPAGHIGEPSGDCRAGNIQFQASKRQLQWLTLTDRAGAGVALLPVAGTPLTGRANAGAADGTVLFASREVAGPRDFSGSWVADHDIKAGKEKPLSGAFILRALAP